MRASNKPTELPPCVNISSSLGNQEAKECVGESARTNDLEVHVTLLKRVVAAREP